MASVGFPRGVPGVGAGVGIADGSPGLSVGFSGESGPESADGAEDGSVVASVGFPRGVPGVGVGVGTGVFPELGARVGGQVP